jgi:uracil-DNA glycosylase
MDRLNEPHARPLMELIRSWVTGERKFPNVDPNDGGVNARVLFLQHTPGRMAVESGFVSRDNRDPTAKNAGEALDYAGFARTDYVRWNVVPYYISTAVKDGKASPREVREAAPYTQAFIDSLPNLRAVVFCGGMAKKAIPHLKLPDGVDTLSTFHCAAQSYNHAHQREHILKTFKKAYELIKSPLLMNTVDTLEYEARELHDLLKEKGEMKINKCNAYVLGFDRYFTGKPCKHGHIAERRADNGTCVECLRLSYATGKGARRAERGLAMK